MGAEQLRQELLKSYASVKQRGKRCASLYTMLQNVLSTHPNMVRVDERDLRVQLDQARAQLSQARSQLATEIARHEQPAAAAAAAGDQDADAALAAAGFVDDEQGGRARDTPVAHDCLVCWDTFNDERRPVALPCGHILCEPCCLKQQERTPKCPSCRATFDRFLPLFFS